MPLETWQRLTASYWAYVSHIDEQVGRILRHLEALGRAAGTAAFFTTDHGEFTGAHRLHDKGAYSGDVRRHLPGPVRRAGPRGGSRDRSTTTS